VQRVHKFEDQSLITVLFSIVLNVQATKTLSQEFRDRALTLMQQLALKSGFSNVSELHSNEIRPIL
jgi:hypothetical protein